MTNNPDKFGCDVCGSQVKWTRHTQFAGSHYFCEGCAKEEVDFRLNDYNRDWEYKVYSVPEQHRASSYGALKAM